MNEEADARTSNDQRDEHEGALERDEHAFAAVTELLLERYRLPLWGKPAKRAQRALAGINGELPDVLKTLRLAGPESLSAPGAAALIETAVRVARFRGRAAERKAAAIGDVDELGDVSGEVDLVALELELGRAVFDADAQRAELAGAAPPPPGMLDELHRRRPMT